MKGTSAPETIRTIVKEAGITGLWRGIAPLAMREGMFAPSYLVIYPFIKHLIQDATDNEGIAITAGAIVTGATIAGLTHPLDTIKTRLQEDYSIKGIRDAIDSLRNEIDEKTNKKSGLRSLYKGVTARGTRAIIAIPLISITYEYLTDKAKTYTEELT